MADIALLHHSSFAAARSPASAEQKVHQASQDFESVLLGQWLQEAEDSFGSVPGNDGDADTSQMKNFAMQHLAREITKSGGMGISKIVEGALTGAGGLSRTAQDTPTESGKDINIPRPVASSITQQSNWGGSDEK